jgi:cytochrome b561
MRSQHIPSAHLIKDMTRQGHWLMYVLIIAAIAVIWLVVFPNYRDQGHGWIAGIFTAVLVLTLIYARGDQRRQH